MRSFVTTSLIAFAQALTLEAEVANWHNELTSEDQIRVTPPAAECCTSAWTSDCNVLQNAVDEAGEYADIIVQTGVYCNKNWYKNVGLEGSDNGKSLKNGGLLKIEDKKYLRIRGQGMPLLNFDGWSGIKVTNSEYITISDLEVAGPALNIDGPEATANHSRISAHDTDGTVSGCGLNETQGTCPTSTCKWSGGSKGCVGKTYSYYTGNGIQIK